MTKEQQKFYDIKHTSNYTTVGEDIDYLIYSDEEKKEVVLLFEESSSTIDWVHNLEFIPFPLKLDNKRVWTTFGYYHAYKSSCNLPVDLFCEAIADNPDYKVVIRGWSFGSAMAKIAARHLRIRGIEVDELTTFGDVKCWLNPFYSNKKNCKVIHEYCTVNDFVTWCVPFYYRDITSKVGEKFSLKKLFKTEYYHTHYDEYDYTKYE